MESNLREIICCDAVPWLSQNTESFDSIVTSIPDQSEVHMPIDEYTEFFKEATRLCLNSVKPKGYCIFLQTDRKQKGLFPKDFYITQEANRLGFRMMWHKIALRKEPGKTDLFRPTYSHMLCFSKKGSPGLATPDVLYHGAITYENGFGIHAVTSVLEFLKVKKIQKVVDPFVGSGTTVALANKLGMNAIGVDIDENQCKKAKALVL